jgi:hypothetical protein
MAQSYVRWLDAWQLLLDAKGRRRVSARKVAAAERRVRDRKEDIAEAWVRARLDLRRIFDGTYFPGDATCPRSCRSAIAGRSGAEGRASACEICWHSWAAYLELKPAEDEPAGESGRRIRRRPSALNLVPGRVAIQASYLLHLLDGLRSESAADGPGAVTAGSAPTDRDPDSELLVDWEDALLEICAPVEMLAKLYGITLPWRWNEETGSYEHTGDKHRPRRGEAPRPPAALVASYCVLAATLSEMWWDPRTGRCYDRNDSDNSRVPVLESPLAERQVVALVAPALTRSPWSLSIGAAKKAVHRELTRLDDKVPVRETDIPWGAAVVGRRFNHLPEKLAAPPSFRPRPKAKSGIPGGSRGVPLTLRPEARRGPCPTRFQRLHYALPETFRRSLWALIAKRAIGPTGAVPGPILELFWNPGAEDEGETDPNTAGDGQP